MKLYFVTGSRFKVEELAPYLAAHPVVHEGKIEVRQYAHSLLEVMDGDLAKVVEDKALQAFEMVRQPVVVEHGGLFFEGLKDLPGPLGRVIWNSVGARMCTFLLPGDSRVARARAMLGYCDGRRIERFLGETTGRIADVARGNYNQGNWDPIFIPDGETETYGEMGPERKRATSPMLKAWGQLLEATHASLLERHG